MASSFATKRLGKELAKINETLPPGIVLVSAPDYTEWTMDLKVLDDNPIYNGQTFRLRLRFSGKYPIEAPETMFVHRNDPPRPIPMHPHVYTNGVICLDLLGTGWSPVQNVESICVSLQSMLTSNILNERPQGDKEFCRRFNSGKESVRGLGFVYDDDSV